MLNELDPQVKALLEQFQANAAQHPAPATPLSAKEKIIALRQMMGASAARRYPAESVSRTEDFAIPGPAGKIPVRLYVPPRGLRGKNWEPECDPQRHLRPLILPHTHLLHHAEDREVEGKCAEGTPGSTCNALDAQPRTANTTGKS
jgi:hypothetical protein